MILEIIILAISLSLIRFLSVFQISFVLVSVIFYLALTINFSRSEIASSGSFIASCVWMIYIVHYSKNFLELFSCIIWMISSLSIIFFKSYE